MIGVIRYQELIIHLKKSKHGILDNLNCKSYTSNFNYFNYKEYEYKIIQILKTFENN